MRFLSCCSEGCREVHDVCVEVSQDLADLKTMMQSVPSALDKLSTEMASFNACYDVLGSCHVMIPKVGRDGVHNDSEWNVDVGCWFAQEDFEMQWDVIGSPRRVMERLSATEASLVTMKMQ
jgi:hypothetical protein